MKASWLLSAPKELIDAFENRQIGIGPEILERLLSDSRMQSTWERLTKRKPDSVPWIMVWTDIVYAKRQSNIAAGTTRDGRGKFRQTRKERRDFYKSLAVSLAELATSIGNGPLDLPIYEYLPEDVLDALCVSDWDSKNSLERAEVAYALLGAWPAASELLRGLGERAKYLAADAMTAPRPDDRDRGDKLRISARTFIWHLEKSIRLRFKAPLLKEVGMVATVVFELKDDEVYDSKYVGNVIEPKVKKEVKAS